MIILITLPGYKEHCTEDLHTLVTDRGVKKLKFEEILQHAMRFVLKSQYGQDPEMVNSLREAELERKFLEVMRL